MSTMVIEDAAASLVPLLRQEAQRLLYRQGQDRARDLEASLGSLTAEMEPQWPTGDREHAPKYLDIPVPIAFRRVYRIADSSSEIATIPNSGPLDIERELEPYVQERSLDEGMAPPCRPSAELDTWIMTSMSREQEVARIFGVLPRYVLVHPDLESHQWYGSFLALEPRSGEGAVTAFTSGLSDQGPEGTAYRHTRDYELYVHGLPGCERWALNLLVALVRSVLVDGEDHLAKLRTVRHLALGPVEAPGLPGAFSYILGVRGNYPRALPMSGGGTKLIPVTLIHEAERRHAEEHGMEELAALMVEEGVDVLSDPDRASVVRTGGRRGFRFWR